MVYGIRGKAFFEHPLANLGENGKMQEAFTELRVGTTTVDDVGKTSKHRDITSVVGEVLAVTLGRQPTCAPDDSRQSYGGQSVELLILSAAGHLRVIPLLAVDEAQLHKTGQPHGVPVMDSLLNQRRRRKTNNEGRTGRRWRGIGRRVGSDIGISLRPGR